MIRLISSIDDLKSIKIPQEFLMLNQIEKELRSNPFGRYLIELENKKIVAYLYYSDIYDRAEINQFEVEISHRNCGKGSNLLVKMIEIVDKNITLEVNKNNLSAIHVYKKFQFKEKAIRKGYYQGIDGILMERER